MECGAPFSGVQIASIALPPLPQDFKSFKRIIIASLRVGARKDERLFPTTHLLRSLADGVEMDLIDHVSPSERDFHILETLSALVAAGASVPNPLNLVFLSLLNHLRCDHVVKFSNLIPIGSVDRRKIWQWILTCPIGIFKDFELILMCDTLDHRLLHFHDISPSSRWKNVSIFDRVVQIAASKPYASYYALLRVLLSFS
jgi:hypothetical protein